MQAAALALSAEQMCYADPKNRASEAKMKACIRSTGMKQKVQIREFQKKREAREADMAAIPYIVAAVAVIGVGVILLK